MIYALGRARCPRCGYDYTKSLRDALFKCDSPRCGWWLRFSPAGPGLCRVDALTSDEYLAIRDEYRRLGTDDHALRMPHPPTARTFRKPDRDAA